MAKRDVDQRPPLTPDLAPDVFLEFYWWKDELTRFCVEHGIPAGGRKLEIRDRVEFLLRTGRIEAPAPKRTSRAGRDSDGELTLDTPVVNFKSDQKTREFFKSVIGPHFHFTAHLNQFRAGRADLTYGDLVREWEADRERRKRKDFAPPIMNSCEYNQYIRDFFADPRNKGRPFTEAVASWNEVKTRKGDRKYRPAT